MVREALAVDLSGDEVGGAPLEQHPGGLHGGKKPNRDVRDNKDGRDLENTKGYQIDDHYFPVVPAVPARSWVRRLQPVL